MRVQAIRALRQALPVLQSEHYGLLNLQAIPNLCRLLYQPDESLVLEVIEALGKIGDGSALHPVKWVAERGRTQQIREAAQAILPILEERHRQEQDPQILLRPTAGFSTPDTLLRAAQAKPETGSEHLLRVSTQEQQV